MRGGPCPRVARASPARRWWCAASCARVRATSCHPAPQLLSLLGARVGRVWRGKEPCQKQEKNCYLKAVIASVSTFALGAIANWHPPTMVSSDELIRLVAAAEGAASKAALAFKESGAAPSSASTDPDAQRAVDALRVLGQQQVSVEVLGRTEAGKRLKKLTKHACSAVGAAAQAAINAWKECVRKEQARGGAGKQEQAGGSKPAAAAAPAGPASTSGAADGSQGAAAGGAGGDEGAAAAATTAEARRQASQEPASCSAPQQPRAGSLEPARTGDETRDKIRKLLAEALAKADGGGGDPCAAAVDVEQAMFVQNGGVNAKYKAKYRTLAWNLKDDKNPELRAKVRGRRHACLRGGAVAVGAKGARAAYHQCALCLALPSVPVLTSRLAPLAGCLRRQVLTGEVPGDVLVNLTAEELASKEMRVKNEQVGCVAGVGCGGHPSASARWACSVPARMRWRCGAGELRTSNQSATDTMRHHAARTDPRAHEERGRAGAEPASIHGHVPVSVRHHNGVGRPAARAAAGRPSHECEVPPGATDCSRMPATARRVMSLPTGACTLPPSPAGVESAGSASARTTSYKRGPLMRWVGQNAGGAAAAGACRGPAAAHHTLPLPLRPRSR